LRPHEAERLFQRSRLHPDSDKPEATGPGTFATIVPTPYAFPLCNPAGTDFAELQSVREPYLGWHFWGEYVVDREIGHNDRYSLRMDGPGSVNGMMYHHMLDTHTEQYLCTVWVKTKNVRGGKGPIITLKYSYADTPRDIVETGMLGDNDWREISFISTVPLTHESSDIIFELDGSGIAWFDDFSLRPIEAGEKVAEKRPAPIAVALPEPVKDLLLDLPCDEGEGLQCVDRSNRGNTVRLLGATWAHTEKRAVLRFAPNTGAFVLRPSPEFSPKTLDGVKGFGLSAMTLEAWIRPAPSTEAGAILGYYYSPVLYLQPAGKEKFSLNLMATPSKGRRVVATSPALIPANEWTHVAATLMTNGSIRLYVNGKQVLDTPFEGMLSSSANHHYISLGVMGKFYGYPYHGDMANLRWWARAATDEEIAAAVAQRP